MVDQYRCQSYYDDNKVLWDCECGKCGTFREQIEQLFEERYLVSVGDEHVQKEYRELTDAIVKLHEAEVEEATGTC